MYATRQFFLSTTITFFLLLISVNIYGQDRGLEVTSVKNAQGDTLMLYKESHALIIGVSNYTHGWPTLPGVKKDVQSVREALEENGFHVVVVENTSHQQLRKAYDDFINGYGLDPENRLLLYFAGHGHTLKATYGEDMGYIVPTDAPNPHYDKKGFLSTAMNMQDIEVFAKRIQSKHAMFMFDACFSGSIFALSRAVPSPIIKYKTSKPVRQFITSGSADEEVPDESIFRAQFVAALKGEADVNNDGYITGTELGEFLQEKVVNYSKESQHPQYGKIRNPNLDKGDFVFVLSQTESDEKEKLVETPKPETPKQQPIVKTSIEKSRGWGTFLKIVGGGTVLTAGVTAYILWRNRNQEPDDPFGKPPETPKEP